MELEALRENIADVDRQMAALFAQRMSLCDRIADEKLRRGLPIEDRAQEARVLSRGAAQLAQPDDRADYLDALQHTISISKRRQRRRLAGVDGETISVCLGVRSFDATVADGCLRRAAELFSLRRRVLVVTDEGVPPVYAQTVAAQCEHPLLVTVPQGEASKSFASLERLLCAMQDAGFTRSDCVCAVGGGVVGDLVGLAASLYQRGVDFYNVPTTLLAQADSAIGGKTAINLDGIKNPVGTFWQPRGVLIDPETLQTLPPAQLANGMAETIKAALLADAALFSRLESGEASLPELIRGAIRVKGAIVEADEREAGLRRILNFGHTIGHGIEAVTGLPHGACVGLGMLPMCADALRPRLAALLRRCGLPTKASADPDAVLQAALHDKKRTNDEIQTVFVEAPGVWRLEPISPRELRQRIETVVNP